MKTVFSLATWCVILLLAAPASIVRQGRAQQPLKVANTGTLNRAAFLKGCVDWLTTQPKGPGRYWLRFVMVSNQWDTVATYTEGELSLSTARPGTFLVGSGTQYFNNRRWACPPTPGAFSPPLYPFDPNKTDKVGLAINTATGQVTLSLLSRGNAKINIDPPYANGVLFGFGDTTPVRPMFLISLEKQVATIPR
jgi:hypothetical protein